MKIEKISNSEIWREKGKFLEEIDIKLVNLLPKDNNLSYSLAFFSLEPQKRSAKMILEKSDDFIVIAKGKALITIDNKIFEMKEKHCLTIPKGTMRFIENNGDDLLEFIAIASPPFNPKECICLEEIEIITPLTQLMAE